MSAENNGELSPPLQAIKIAPDKPGQNQREMILSGEKTLTVRAGSRDHWKGPVMLGCEIEPWAVMAEIIEIRHCLLHDVTDEEVKADGVNGELTGLWADLRKYYPEMTLLSPVTVIRWANVRGKLVNDYRKSKGTG